MIGLVRRLDRATAHRTPLHVVRSRLSRPVASFCFDDFPTSAATTGASILEERGVRGTFYASGGLAGSDYRGLPHFEPAHIKDLAARGHEIGCHAFDHVRFPEAPGGEIDRSLDKNVAFFREHLGDFRAISFAYPFGDVAWSVKRTVSRRFPIARGVRRGVNVQRMDYSELLANPLDRRWEQSTDIQGLLEAARRDNGWLIFFTHDVQADPTSEGCHPDRLAKTIDGALASGFEILPMRAAAARARFG